MTSTPLPVTRQEAWQLLKTHLVLTHGFSLLIVSAPDAFTLGQIARDVSLLLAGDNWRKLELDPAQPAESLALDFLRLDKGGTTHRLIWVDTAALAAPSLDQMREHWEQAFTSLNRRRNQLSSSLHGTLALTGTPEMVDALREFAPDLWSIRSAFIRFTAAPRQESFLPTQTPATRRQQALEAILSAFRGYEEIGLDNYTNADQARPDIWDIFVAPPCSQKHLLPEDIDAAQHASLPRLTTEDLLPKLATPEYSRTVLLADPGMGKSTLVQCLIAMLASGRHLSGAPQLTGLFPVPIILREIVPLLPQEPWTWDLLIQTLLTRYRREEKAPPLFSVFASHPQEFGDLLRSSGVFFFIDGLDEIGGLAKRRQIVSIIQEGIRTAHPEARWLITSRIIGYEEAPVDFVDVTEGLEVDRLSREVLRSKKAEAEVLSRWVVYGNRWEDLAINDINAYDLERELNRKRRDRRANDALLAKINNTLGGQGSLIIPIARRLHLAPFDDQRQEQFARRWFRLRRVPDYSDELFRELRLPAAHGVRVIARVPNLLCFMVILKRSGKPLPDGRSALYGEIAKAYLSGIDAAYRLSPVHGHDCPFDLAARTEILALIAAHMQFVRTGPVDDDGKEISPRPAGQDSVLIPMPVLEYLLLPVIQRLQDQQRVPRTPTALELLRDLLDHIARRSGLLIPRGDDADGRPLFAFTHLSFLEYFTAVWLDAEFKRLRDRFARIAEAASEGVLLTEADLDAESPPPQPALYGKAQFARLAAAPLWHEVLIFLAEMHAGAPAMLLRWLFPGLHTATPPTKQKPAEPLAPVVPQEAVSLLVKLAGNRELALPESTRRQWWQRLWHARLQWPYHTWDDLFGQHWHIAPRLLDRTETLDEVVDELTHAAQTSKVASSNNWGPTLDFMGCDLLTEDHLGRLGHLNDTQTLILDGCVSVKNLSFVIHFPKLKFIDLSLCDKLTHDSLRYLSQLEMLETLFLTGCEGLQKLDGLEGAPKLQSLFLSHCTGLECAEALAPIVNIPTLVTLYLDGCSGLKQLPDLTGMKNLRCLDLTGSPAAQHVSVLKKQLHPDCQIRVANH